MSCFIIIKTKTRSGFIHNTKFLMIEVYQILMLVKVVLFSHTVQLV